MSKAINLVKDGYLVAVGWVVKAGEWVAAHPHKTILAILGFAIGFVVVF